MRNPVPLAILLFATLTVARAGTAAEAPVPVHTKAPAVMPPAGATTAFATLLVETDAYGFVTRVQVQEASTSALGEACADAVRHWRYAPARKYGQPVPARFLQPFRFGPPSTIARARDHSAGLRVLRRTAPSGPPRSQ